MLRKKFFYSVAFLLLFSVLISSCAKRQDPPIFIPPDVTKKNYPTVIIDAGHGGEDGGAVGTNGIYEKELNLMIASELRDLLEAKGIPTRLTRTEDILLYDRNTDYQGRKKALDMAARLAIAQEYENAIFVSIHMNSFPQEKYSGLQVYYSENDACSRSLAELIQSLTVKNIQPSNTRKIKPSSGNIYLLEKISHPAVLIECGFLSNRQECALLCSEEYRARLCMTLCSSIINYFETYGNCS
ncbi:MAG: hypothetical protein E7653_01475 [Ruminococcaceae bacterium]|nr:hypothetical protein [Oscillospiraceae bacterium]